MCRAAIVAVLLIDAVVLAQSAPASGHFWLSSRPRNIRAIPRGD